MAYPLPEIGFALCVFLIGAGFYFYFDTRLKAAQKNYEIEFLSHHQLEDNIPSPVIELSFEHRHAQNLLSLCKQYHSTWSPMYLINKLLVESYEPKMEYHYIGFRRIDPPGHEPMRIEVIRCTNWYALIANNQNLGYLLEKSEPAANNGFIFHIYAQFNYEEMELIPSSETEMLINSQSFILGQDSTNGNQSPDSRFLSAGSSDPIEALERKPSKQD